MRMTVSKSSNPGCPEFTTMFYTSKKRQRPPSDKPVVTIEKMSHEMRGIARMRGKTVFIDNTLPGETARFQYTATRSKFDEGVAVEILQPSADHCQPRCPHVAVYGGCALQHMNPQAQIRGKQQILLDQLERFANISVPGVLSPLTADAFGYRRKARLGIRYSKGKGKDGVVFGFREKRSNNLPPISECPVLPEILAGQIPHLRNLIGECEGRAHISHLEVAVGEDAAAIVVRHLKPLSQADQGRWLEFAETSGLHLYLQPGDAGSVHKVCAGG